MKRTFCLIATLALAACSTTPKVQTQARPGTDFTRFHSFALLPLPSSGPASDPGLMLRLAEPARHAVVESLAARGLTEADRAQADLAVNLRGQSMPKVEVTDWGYTRTAYTRYGRPVPVYVGERDVRTYDERTLIVEIFDNHTKDLAWTGWTKREARGEIKVEEVQEAIRNILAHFPPPAPGTGAVK